MPLRRFSVFFRRNLEIHKVFLRFLTFIATKKTSKTALADFIIVYLFSGF